jgi:hypothetical protein
VSVTVVTVTVVTVPMVTVAGFEWPVPTHGTIFSLPDLKSKPGMPVAAVFSRAENRQDEAERRPSDFPSLPRLRWR